MSLITTLRTWAFALVILFYFPLSAQNKEAEQYKIDSVLYAYYQCCLENVSSPIVLSMADTLYRMSGEKGDKRMQAVALSTHLDYYYYKAQEDSIIAHTNRVKDFARLTKQSKYYYFSWGDRLITYYIKSGKINTAYFEAQKMLKEAQDADDKEGLANCYNVLANIYVVKKMERQAFESRLKRVELIETNNLTKYNLINSYLEIANYYLREKKNDKALEAIEKAEASGSSSSHKFLCLLGYAKYYTSTKQFDLVEKYLRDANQLIKTEKRLFIHRKTFLDASFDYYVATKQFNKALVAIDSLQVEQKKLGEDGINVGLIRKKGQLYHQMGNDKAAAAYLTEYIQAQDSLDEIHEQNATGEFATLLGMEKLSAEKQQLTLDIQEEHLRHTRIVVFCLIGFSLILLVFFYREYLSNRKLKASGRLLLQKNADLMESEEQLRLAKDQAERASQMKTIFIQNMTHEIRTPLNAIVGFSQIITSMFEAEGETEEYTNIIEENSTKLLKLIDDVLDLSDQEASQNLVITDTDINKHCAESIAKVKRYLHNGVELTFQPGCELLVFPSNGVRLEQILFNLLHNSARSTLKGNILLAYRLSGDKQTLELTVTDTGVGIPEDKHEEIFERFVKLDDFSQGFGLGLPICRMLSSKLGGSVRIDKDYTDGCRFVLTFPSKRS